MHGLSGNLGSVTHGIVSVLFSAKAPGTPAPGGNRHICSSLPLPPGACGTWRNGWYYCTRQREQGGGKDAYCYWIDRLCQHPSLHFRGRVSNTHLMCTYMHQVISPDAAEDFLYSDIIALFMERLRKGAEGDCFNHPSESFNTVRMVALLQPSVVHRVGLLLAGANLSLNSGTWKCTAHWWMMIQVAISSG